jgi:hypothetical protein
MKRFIRQKNRWLHQEEIEITSFNEHFLISKKYYGYAPSSGCYKLNRRLNMSKQRLTIPLEIAKWKHSIRFSKNRGRRTYTIQVCKFYVYAIFSKIGSKIHVLKNFLKYFFNTHKKSNT